MNSSPIFISLFLVLYSVACLPESSQADSMAGAGEFKPTVLNKVVPTAKAPKGMVWIPGGEFSMGSQEITQTTCPMDSAMRLVKDSQPIHRVYVDGFWMDQTEVTNDDFEKFVKATGYVTVAERPLNPEEFPGANPADLVPGAAVFSPPQANVPLNDSYQWWKYVPGASWRHPLGPDSTIEGRGNYPVVQIAYEDAEAYAKWIGKRLPTEAEFEFAARGGISGKLYAWGDEFKPGGKYMANTFQGKFPNHDSGEDGFVGSAPVRSFPPNKFGLYDLAGNVWEWCSDWYRPDYYQQISQSGVVKNPQGPTSSYDPQEPSTPKRVHRGGSFLCTDQYCSRYMVGTRGKGEVSTGTNHVGFRLVMSDDPKK